MLQYLEQQKSVSDTFISVQPRLGEFKLVDEQSAQRDKFEHFVQAGFASSYAAKITEFMPQLIAIETSGIQAVLGVRSGMNCLFVEQYLDRSVEQYLAFQGDTHRNQILEVGNLVSVTRKHTLRLFMFTALSAIQSGYRYFVFSATQHVVTLLKSFHLPLTYLQDADGAKLGDRVHYWGSYYQTSPKVLALDLKFVVALCQRSKSLSRLYSELIQQVIEL